MFVITDQLIMVAVPPVARSKVPTSSVMEQRNANKIPFVNILFTFSCLKDEIAEFSDLLYIHIVCLVIHVHTVNS